MAKVRPICVDLFAGAGGLALGFEQAGFDVVAAVEFDPIHAAIHKLNFPETAVVCRDVREISGDDIRTAAGIGRSTIDAVVGGPPCQGFSLIGHRVLSDPRNELVFHYLRIVDELRPRTFIFENVAGMASGAHHALLDELFGQFAGIGYKVRRPYEILNASHFGVPQDRRRLILLGARRDTRVPEYPRPTTVPPKRTPELELQLPVGPTVSDALSDLPDIEDFEELRDADVLDYRASGGSRYARISRGDVADHTDYSYPRIRRADRITGCLRAEHTKESRRRFAATAPGTTEPISRFYRLPPDGLCNTLRAGTATDRGAFTSPRPIHPVFDRCISVREAARLHSYPDWFRFHRTIWHGFRQIGNSVPPLLARAIAASVMKTGLEVAPIRPTRSIRPGEDSLASLNMKQASALFDLDAPPISPRRRQAAGA